MTNKDITKIYFEGDEIVALYQGSTLIFKKSGGVVPPSPTGVYTVRGTLKPDSTAQNIGLKVNGVDEQIDINEDKTFEHTFTNVPVTSMEYFTQSCKDELNTLDLSSLDTSQITSMIEAFYGCSNLTSIDLTNVDTSNVTNMSYMFFNNFNLTSLDVSNFNTSNVTDMNRMFCICSGLTSLDVSNFNTTNVTNMSGMFEGCRNLASLDVSNFNTSNVTDMSYMFARCGSLTSIDLSGSETTKLTSIGDMFSECYKLKDLYINFDLKSISEYQIVVFLSCRSLTNVVGKFNNYKQYLDLSSSPLTVQSAMVFINGLATVTEKRTLSLNATTYDSLTTEQIAIATSKGWTVTRN